MVVLIIERHPASVGIILTPKRRHCTSGHCASGQLSLTWFLSLDGWVPTPIGTPRLPPPASVPRTGAVPFCQPCWLALGPRLIKSTTQGLRPDRQRPGSFEPAGHSVLRCA